MTAWVFAEAMDSGTTGHGGEPSPTLGLLAGRYELRDLLGTGGMADVYAARDRLLDRDVAIKFFRPLEGRADRARFVSEARLLAGLSHPGLVVVYDASFEGHRRPYLIMPLVDGGTLRQRLDADGSLVPGQVARLGARLATALAHVHGNGIVHRDIKPSNVLADAAGDYYLADFGLAWALGSARLTNSGELVGTACYLAPEQVTGAVVDQKADIYALGLVLLECLTGRTEYEGSDVEMAVARLSRAPTVPETYGPSWRELLGVMTDHDPSNRPDAAECARRLHAIARAPVIAAPGHSTASAARLARAGKVRAGLGAVGAVGGALAALVLTVPTGTAGVPVPDGAPGRHTTAPTRDDGSAQSTPVPAATGKVVAPNTARPPQAGVDSPVARPKAATAEPAKDDKPKPAAKTSAKHGKSAKHRPDPPPKPTK